jgi:hypothetical protein
MAFASSLAVKNGLQTALRAPPITGRLDAARLAVEGRFLEAGEVLGQAVEGVGRLIASLDSLTKTLDPETVKATTAELKAAAASLLTLPDRHAGRREILERMAGLGDDLAGGIGEMRRNLAYLRVFAINIKITAAGVAAAGTEFGMFAQEICDCIELGRTKLGAFDSDLGALRAELRTAFAQEQTLAEHCHGLLPAVPDGLTASAEELVAHHAGVSRVALEVAGLARQVQKKVGSALAALQIGDITRQRIEHVQQALAMLAQVEGLDDEPRERLEAFIHALLAEQLRATAGDFHRDVARIAQNMSGMATDASEILRLRDLAVGQVDSGGGGFLQQMESHVGQALELVGHMERADQAATVIGGSAAQAAGDLSAQIAGLQAIKTDVQQMALNTTLKCSRIGDTGKPLAVIAIELRLHAGHLDLSANTALASLSALTQEAGGLAGSPMNDGDGAGAALSEAASHLRSTGDAMTADLATLAQLGESVVAGLHRATARLDFQREIGAVLDEAAEALAEMAGPDLPWTDDLTQPLGNLLAAIAKTYTMAQERDAHRIMTEGLTLDTAVAAPAAVAVEDPDDVLF